MRLINKNFKYLVLILLLILLLNFRFGQVEVISFNTKSFNENLAKEYTLTTGKYKVGKEIEPGFYDIYIEEDSILNGMEYQEGQLYNNCILNKSDVIVLEGKVNIEPSKDIYWNAQGQQGTYLVNEDGTYNFTIINPDSSSSVDFVVNGQIVGEIEMNNLSQKITLKKGDVLYLQVNKNTEFEVEKNEK